MVGLVTVIRVGGDADAPTHRDVDAVEHERGVQRVRELLRDVGGFLWRVQARDRDPELVAAEPCHGVARAQRSLQPRTDLLDQFVAAVVAQRVVDLLEAGQVEQQHADPGAVAARRRDRLMHAIEEQQPVRQAREVVEHREPSVLLGAPRQLVAVLPDPMRRPHDDAEQHGPQQDETAGDDEQEAAGVVLDLSSDRRPRHVDLERADVLAAEPDRHVDLEQFAELPLVDVLCLVQMADLGGELAVKALLEIFLDREPLSDQLVLIRVQDLAVG
jgi:hypothetical protein